MSIDGVMVVVARGARWRVIGIEEGDGCRAFRLKRVYPAPAGLERTLLEPFDRLVPLSTEERPRVVTPQRAWQATLALIAGEHQWCTPAEGVTARLDLLPWQLVPVVSVLEGGTRRVLVADGVGLGKTIQAGFLVAEVLARSPSARVLVLVPAGLRTQWADELRTRFGLAADVADLEWVEREASRLPAGANPWAMTRLAIASLDFAKRHEVLPGPDAIRWTLVVVDEAHRATTGTDRGALVDRLCARARHVLLLTATPHDGSEGRYQALLRLGRLPDEPPLLLVRRRRGQVSPDWLAPRWHPLRMSLSPAERHAHELLERYAHRLERDLADDDASGVRLALLVLRKRAASSAWALARTARRRRALLGDTEPRPIQGSLLLDVAIGTEGVDPALDAILGIPGLENRQTERAWLGAIAEAALRAARAERKIALLDRLRRRVSEPLLVFTEYLDTLTHVARTLGASTSIEVLHGQLSPSDRERAIKRFAAGEVRLLVATDAASEGLNLHRHCRLVVLLDLPWTPTRLEQRIGRLDRLGQRHRVHALALVARSPFELSLLERLGARGARIEQALVSGDGLFEAGAQQATRQINLRRRALVLGLELAFRGSVSQAPGEGVVWRETLEADLSRRRPWISCLSPGTTRDDWSGVVAIVEAHLTAGDGVLLDRAAVPLHVPLAVPRLTTPRALRRFVCAHVLPATPGLIEAARRALVFRWRKAEHAWRSYGALCAMTDAAIQETAQRQRPVVQLPLFGHYQAGAAATAATPRLEDGPGTPDGVPHRVDDGRAARSCAEASLRVAVLLLRPGPGRRAPAGTSAEGLRP